LTKSAHSTNPNPDGFVAISPPSKLPSRLRLRNTQTANRTIDKTTVELRRPQQEAFLVVAACGAQPSNPQQQTAFGSAPLSAMLLTDDWCRGGK
jgi:hypothetical protein